MKAKGVINSIIELLETLRCGEPHEGGPGTCNCQTNEIIDEILDYLEDPGAPWYDEDHYDE